MLNVLLIWDVKKNENITHKTIGTQHKYLIKVDGSAILILLK